MDDQLRHYSARLAYEIDSWGLKAALEADDGWKRDGYVTHSGAAAGTASCGCG